MPLLPALFTDLLYQALLCLADQWLLVTCHSASKGLHTESSCCLKAPDIWQGRMSLTAVLGYADFAGELVTAGSDRGSPSISQGVLESEDQ